MLHKATGTVLSPAGPRAGLSRTQARRKMLICNSILIAALIRGGPAVQISESRNGQRLQPTFFHTADNGRTAC